MSPAPVVFLDVPSEHFPVVDSGPGHVELCRLALLAFERGAPKAALNWGAHAVASGWILSSTVASASATSAVQPSNSTNGVSLTGCDPWSDGITMQCAVRAFLSRSAATMAIRYGSVLTCR
ncbi:hypothetical protein ABH932_005416 [Streptacidiphilus sp. MAP5-52]